MTNASPNAEKSWLDAIRRDWDTRARENARAYINWPDVPNEEDAFFASGKTDYDLYVTPFLKKMSYNPREKTALEIGCGVGRIARWMSQDFAQYIGVDVSPEMIRKASSYNLPRAQFQAVSGGDLAGVPSESVDFVWSFAVFQHVPDKRAIFNYFQEAARVLRPRRNFSPAHERPLKLAPGRRGRGVGREDLHPRGQSDRGVHRLQARPGQPGPGRQHDGRGDLRAARRRRR